ncbi:MAG TPA: histidine kinase, partial [Puia sp.]|nr:histidine kinase [Puia sp.]
MDAAQNVWLASIGAGVLLLRPGSIHSGHIRFERLPPPFEPFLHSEFRAIVGDKEKNIWMAGVNSGLFKYNPYSGVFSHITTDQGLASNTVFCLYCDKEDNLWIGTNSGLQKLVHKDVLFYSSRQGLPADLVLDLLPLPGNSAITCGYSGVGYQHGYGERIRPWKPPLEDEYFLKLTGLKKEYFGLSLRKLISLRAGSTGISARKIFPLPMHFRSMISLGDEGLLLGGDSCILLFRNEKLSTLTRDHVRWISCMALDSSGMLWTGGLDNDIVGYSMQGSLARPAAQLAFRYKGRATGPQDNVKCMTIDCRQRIVYGMTQSGIYVMARDHGTLKKLFWIGTASGLSNNHVESLLWHDDTTLLAGTGYGLDKIIFPANKDSFYVQNISDFYNFSTTIYSIKKDERGNILLGAESGLIKIPSVDIERRALRNLPIVISSIQLLSGKNVTPGAEKTIELPYNNNGLNIYYSSPSFINERTTEYTYQLTGSTQHQWSQPSFSNHVTLLNLSPGNYHFAVRPVNIYGQASSQTAGLEIVIRPPVWQRWWFPFLLLGLVAALAFLVVRRRISAIRRESAMKNKIAETEMMALRAQMNPHFIFNCMNIIDGLITNNRKAEALNFLQKFSKLIRLVLENSQYQEVPLNQDLQALRLYIELEVVRSNNHFSYIFDIDRELQEQNYKIPPLLLQPYIENAIVHGLRNKESGDGILRVDIKKAGDS